MEETRYSLPRQAVDSLIQKWNSNSSVQSIMGATDIFLDIDLISVSVIF
jgi:hypothetical protein